MNQPAANLTLNRTLLAKADLTLGTLTTDGGLLVPAQAKKFLRLVIKQAVLVKEAKVVTMRSHNQLIEKSRFNGRVLRAGEEAQALSAADRASLDLSKEELNAQLFKGEVRLNNEVLQDNIEGGTLRQTVMTQMAEAVGRDMDEVAIQGDTASGDPFLAKFDGVLKQATSNIVDHAGARTNKTLWKNMLKAMPSEFLRSKRSMRFYTSTDSEIDYRDFLADRATVVGDRFLEQDSAITYSGVTVRDVDLMPENLGSGDKTNTLLVDPKNIQVGIWRDVTMETDKLVSEGVMIIVVTLRFDVRFAEETAVVKGTEVLVG